MKELKKEIGRDKMVEMKEKNMRNVSQRGNNKKAV